MSLHLNQQCQRATKTDASANPSYRVHHGASFSLTTPATRPGHRCGDTHLGKPPQPVKPFLQLSYTHPQNQRFPTGFGICSRADRLCPPPESYESEPWSRRRVPLTPRRGSFVPPVEFALRHHLAIREVAPASHTPEVAYGGRTMISAEAKHA